MWQRPELAIKKLECLNNFTGTSSPVHTDWGIFEKLKKNGERTRTEKVISVSYYGEKTKDYE